MGVSVSTLREEFKKHIKPFVSDISKYGTHSMKSGAASNPAGRKIAGNLLDIHAGWRCESTKHRYIKHGLSERLAVFKELSIMIFVYIFIIVIIFFPVFVGDCLIGIRFSFLLAL